MATRQETRGSHLTPREQCGLEQCGPKPAILERPEQDTASRPDRLWSVIVWNDPINLMTYVTYVFQKLFGYSLEKATKLMLEVHNEGRSVVATTEREKAEYYVGQLHAFGLQATLEKIPG
jgi:ATP-dependent Clp protease adaptor protein ClpS